MLQWKRKSTASGEHGNESQLDFGFGRETVFPPFNRLAGARKGGPDAPRF